MHTSLLPSEGGLGRKYKCVGLSVSLISICLEIGAILWGLDMGFFGNEVFLWTPGLADTNDLAYTHGFAFGCLLFPLLYLFLQERIALPLLYLVYLTGTGLFIVNGDATLGSRALQGLALGVLFPWTFSYFVHSRTKYRMESIFIFLLLLLGAWTIGYLIRLIGGPLELSLIHYALIVVSIAGMGVAFAPKDPDRIVLDSLTKRDPSAKSSQIEADAFYCSVLESIEHYDVEPDGDETCLAFAQQLSDVRLFELDLRDHYSWWKNIARYLRASFGRWAHALLAITIFPIQLLQLSLPHELGEFLPFFYDAIYTDMLLFVVVFLCAVVGVVTVNRIHLAPKTVLAVEGCVCLLLSGLCGVEAISEKASVGRIVGLGKALAQLVALIVYSVFAAPTALNQAIEVGTMTTLPIGIALTWALLPYLFGGWFALTSWLASLLTSQFGGYLLVGCIYLGLACWSRSIIDYRQWTLYEVSLVSGLYEQEEEPAL